jgi:hypothetical protein
VLNRSAREIDIETVVGHLAACVGAGDRDVPSLASRCFGRLGRRDNMIRRRLRREAPGSCSVDRADLVEQLGLEAQLRVGC